MTEPIIRPIRSEDWEDHWALRTQPNVVWGTLQLPTLPREVVVAQSGPQANNYVFVAEVDGKVVGSCGIHGSTSPRSRHRFGLGMSVHDAYQGRGLGKRLMAAALDLADNYLGVERVELDVYTDNPRAIHLYKSFGFEDEGIIRSMAFRDGAYVDALQMGRLRGRAAAAPRTVAPPLPSGPTGRSLPDDLNIRSVRPEDARAIHAIFVQRGVLANLNRIPALHLDEVKKEVSGLNWGQHMVVAETQGRVIAAAYMNQGRPGRRQHVGIIEWIAVDLEWQGCGVGTSLLQFLLNLADRWVNLKRVEWHVVADAALGLTLGHRFEFKTEAILRSAFFRDGQFVDVCVMGRMVGL
ncbi:MAG TPA: GNAT family N-acetyltransferase [Symbiobacteriaceae bacterium]|nr:GNAT family N-acetyltransferase [Symbiobacteriaceae bacterium]